MSGQPVHGRAGNSRLSEVEPSLGAARTGGHGQDRHEQQANPADTHVRETTRQRRRFPPNAARWGGVTISGASGSLMLGGFTA